MRTIKTRVATLVRIDTYKDVKFGLRFLVVSFAEVLENVNVCVSRVGLYISLTNTEKFSFIGTSLGVFFVVVKICVFLKYQSLRKTVQVDLCIKASC